MSLPVVTRLFFYPIKSMRGLEVKELPLDKQGAVLDRQWMIVDSKNIFITQRQRPDFAKIGLALVDGASLELTAGGQTIVDFGLMETESEPLQVKVWQDEVKAFEVSKEVSADLSKFLGKEVRLVKMAPECDRPGRFSDQKPLLVLSEESVLNLEEKAKVSLSVHRFRANIVIRGGGLHAEDTWAGFKMGALSFRRLKPCTRCRITQVHPLTGEVGEEPLKTLTTYRKIEKGIAFGQYYENDLPGEIKVAQTLSVF